jgi:hypothetical protein
MLNIYLKVTFFFGKLHIIVIILFYVLLIHLMYIFFYIIAKDRILAAFIALIEYLFNIFSTNYIINLILLQTYNSLSYNFFQLLFIVYFQFQKSITNNLKFQGTWMYPAIINFSKKCRITFRLYATCPSETPVEDGHVPLAGAFIVCSSY